MTQSQDATPAADHPRVETAEAARALCRHILETSAELVDVLDRETAVLKKGRPGDIGSIYVRKAALNAMLTRDMSAFRRDTEFIAMAAPEEIDAIKRQHAELQNSLKANQDALVAVKAVSESLLHTVADKAGARTSGPEVYDRDADISAKASGRPAAISVNTVL